MLGMMDVWVVDADIHANAHVYMKKMAEEIGGITKKEKPLNPRP